MKISALDLRVFAAIVDLGGISAAARKLGAQKSTISRDLAALETRIGARLIERSTRRLRLTEAGETLAAYARRVDEEIDNAEAALEALGEAPARAAGRLRALFLRAQRAEPRSSLLFRAACPEVRLR